MKRRLPPLPWLRAFEASARHLSFTHAADELGLTQAAISKQVKGLEIHLREQLFQRRARSLVLTKAGASYLPKVRDAFDRLAAGTAEVFGNRQAELLTIKASVGFSTHWLASRLGAFRSLHPDIDFRIISSIWNEESDEEVDLEVRYGTGSWAGYDADRLTHDKITPVCNRKLIYGNPPLRKPEDLEHHTLLHVMGYEEGWATWLEGS